MSTCANRTNSPIDKAKIIDGLFYELPKTILDAPFSTQIPRKALLKLLAPGEKNQPLNTRLTMQVYLFSYFIQYFDGKTPFFSIFELADMFDCSPRSITNILERLQNQGLITYSHYEHYNHYVQIIIQNYKSYFAKFGGGYITLKFSDFIDIFHINLNKKYTDLLEKPVLNEIRAKILYLANSKVGQLNRLFYRDYKKYFPKNIQRRGLLSRLFHRISSEDQNVSAENKTLPNFITLYNTNDPTNDERERINGVVEKLEERYYDYVTQNGYIAYVNEESRTLADDCLFRLLHKLAAVDNKNRVENFKTTNLIKFASLIISIGYNKFVNLLGRIHQYININSFNNNGVDLYDLKDNKIDDLANYLKRALYITIA